MLRLPVVALVFVLSAPAFAAAEGGAGTVTAAVAVAAKAAAATTPAPLPVWALRSERRPAALPVLYGTYAAVQALDIVSTRKALAAGGVERNPMMRGGAGPAIAVKAAAGLSTIYFTERAWKKNRVGAIVLMAALNGATTAIAVHNLHVARR